jgi:hypothetical protein
VSGHPAFDRLVNRLKEKRRECADLVLCRLSPDDYNAYCGKAEAFAEALEIAEDARKNWLSGDDEDGQEP